MTEFYDARPPATNYANRAEAHTLPTERRSRPRSPRLLSWLHPAGVQWHKNLNTEADATAIAEGRRALSLVFGPGRYFPVSVEGWENLPPSPVMLVSNHSGGTLFLDSWGLLWAWYGRFGPRQRPLHPAVHDMLLGNPFTGPFMTARGAVRAHPVSVTRVLEQGHDLLVMPGGDLDVWRPYRDRYRVRFAGRTGYARIALQIGVPIVPVAHSGAHETLIVLSDGQWLARALRLPTLVRAHIWPIHLSLPWGLTIGPWPHLPVPARLRYRFGPPIDPREFEACGAAPPSPEAIRALDERVRAALQHELDRLAQTEGARARR